MGIINTFCYFGTDNVGPKMKDSVQFGDVTLPIGLLK